MKQMQYGRSTWIAAALMAAAVPLALTEFNPAQIDVRPVVSPTPTQQPGQAPPSPPPLINDTSMRSTAELGRKPDERAMPERGNPPPARAEADKTLNIAGESETTPGRATNIYGSDLKPVQPQPKQ